MPTHYYTILPLIILLTSSLMAPADIAVNRPVQFQEPADLKEKRVIVMLNDKKKRQRSTLRGNILRLTKDSIYLIHYSSSKKLMEQGHEEPLAIPFSRVKKVKLHNYRGKERKRRHLTTFASILTLICFVALLVGGRRQNNRPDDYQSSAFWVGVYGVIIFGIMAIINLFGWLRNIKTIPVDDTLTTAQFLIMQSYVL
ncbi:MAG: hypothetical protein AAGG75_04155 [Bacteroidota bacterium]